MTFNHVLEAWLVKVQCVPTGHKQGQERLSPLVLVMPRIHSSARCPTEGYVKWRESNS